MPHFSIGKALPGDLIRRLSVTLLLCLGWNAAQASKQAATSSSPPAAMSSPHPAAAPARVFPVVPVQKADGSRWRLGYLQGGDYADYPVILAATVNGLVKLGWMSPIDLPSPDAHSAREIWDVLVRQTKSDYLEFVADGFFAPGNFDAALREPTREALADRLSRVHDLDLMIGMGTWAGQDLARLPVAVPSVIASTSDPIAAGIVASAADSGHDHIHAKVEPLRYDRQVRLFHDLVPFKTLGIVYEDSVEGRTFGGVDAVERMAKELDFKIVACHAPFNNVTNEVARQAAHACFEAIAPQVDAVYVTVHRGINAASIGGIVDTLTRAQVPSFSMLGTDQVRKGVLMSMAQGGYGPVGLFHAEVIARIFHGARPRELSQIWLSPAEIAINLETARAIGFDPTVDVLLSSDEVYSHIER